MSRFGQWPRLQWPSGGGGGGKAPVTPTRRIEGLSGYTAGLTLATGNNQGIQGALAGFWAAMIVRVDSQATSATRIIFNSFQGGASKGWDLRSGGFNASFAFNAYFAGVAKQSPVYTWAAGNVGKLALIHALYDGALLRLFVQGVEVGVGTAAGGAFSLPTLNPCACGIRADGGGLAATDLTVFGCAGGDGFVPTPAEIATHYAAVVTASAMVSIPAKTTRLYRFPSAWNPPVTVTESIGGQNFNVTTGLASQFTLRRVFQPVWL